MIYRANVHENTNYIPNLVILGREVSLPIDIVAAFPFLTNCALANVEWVCNVLEISFSTVHENLKLSFRKQTRFYDSHLKLQAFNVGDVVWRWYMYPPLANQKLGSRWIGSYKFLKKYLTYHMK